MPSEGEKHKLIQCFKKEERELDINVKEIKEKEKG
jgi:hypothetical protein